MWASHYVKWQRLKNKHWQEKNANELLLLFALLSLLDSWLHISQIRNDLWSRNVFWYFDNNCSDLLLYSFFHIIFTSVLLCNKLGSTQFLCFIGVMFLILKYHGFTKMERNTKREICKITLLWWELTHKRNERKMITKCETSGKRSDCESSASGVLSSVLHISLYIFSKVCMADRLAD